MYLNWLAEGLAHSIHSQNIIYHYNNYRMGNYTTNVVSLNAESTLPLELKSIQWSSSLPLSQLFWISWDQSTNKNPQDYNVLWEALSTIPHPHTPTHSHTTVQKIHSPSKCLISKCLLSTYYKPGRGGYTLEQAGVANTAHVREKRFNR